MNERRTSDKLHIAASTESNALPKYEAIALFIGST